jgi:hypothetical protein
MDLAAAWNPRYELAEARRFAQVWERDASLRLREGDETVLVEYHKHGRLLDAGTVEQAERSAARAWLADTLNGHHALLIVDTNEQAARLSAQLRADLVRLGKVTEHGVPLGLQGTYAGVGDLIQTRRNGWHLAGIDGNRRGPINRELFRVVETRPDGSLVVTSPHTGGMGERLTLPTDYVADHVALGYASTVHAGQGPDGRHLPHRCWPRHGRGGAVCRDEPRPSRQHRARHHPFRTHRRPHRRRRRPGRAPVAGRGARRRVRNRGPGALRAGGGR